jgi:hypothetical protein
VSNLLKALLCLDISLAYHPKPGRAELIDLQKLDNNQRNPYHQEEITRDEDKLLTLIVATYCVS